MKFNVFNLFVDSVKVKKVNGNKFNKLNIVRIRGLIFNKKIFLRIF